MSLTVGTGPFAEHAARFNIDVDRSAPLLIWDPVPQRVRALIRRDPYSRVDVYATTRHVRADPQHDAERVRDMLCFFNERVDLELDGMVGDRPRTQYSREE